MLKLVLVALATALSCVSYEVFAQVSPIPPASVSHAYFHISNPHTVVIGPDELRLEFNEITQTPYAINNKIGIFAGSGNRALYIAKDNARQTAAAICEDKGYSSVYDFELIRADRFAIVPEGQTPTAYYLTYQSGGKMAVKLHTLKTQAHWVFGWPKLEAISAWEFYSIDCLP